MIALNEIELLLKREREERGLSLREAASKIGISHTYIANLEKGVDPKTGKKFEPTPAVLRKIANFYNISYMKLMFLCGYIDEATDVNATGDDYKYQILAKKMSEIKQNSKEDFEDIYKKILEY